MPSLMESIISLDVGAQEPWPNDVQLFQPYPMEQILLPDNANCLATQAYLHMCGLPFKIEHRSNAEYMSPSGKVPFIKCGAFVVSELEPIVQFVANKGISLTEDFDNEQKSDLRAYMSLIFSVLMNAELYICWCDKRTYNEVTKVRNGSVYPWPLNHYQNWTKKSAVIKKLKLLNWYQKTLGSVYQEVETCCQALSERLEGKEYFFGSKPTEVDALLYGHTYSIFSNPVDFPNLFVIYQRFPNLIIHCKRICFHYTFLRYIDFTKTDTDIESSRESSIHNLVEESKTTIFTQIWNYITSKHGHTNVDTSDHRLPESETDTNKIEQISKSNPQIYKDIRFKKTVDPCIKFTPAYDEDVDSMKSINYLGHKVIQQHLQQDLRNKLSDFTIDTNSDLWSEKDLCYIISDSDLIRKRKNNYVTAKRSPSFLLDKEDITFGLDEDDTKQNLEMKYSSSHCSISCNISEQLNWLHRSSTSTINMNFSNKFNGNSFTENKNDTLNYQENIDIDADNKSNSNASELDWLTDYTSDTKVDHFDHKEKRILLTLDTNNKDAEENIIDQQIMVTKFRNCSIDGDCDSDLFRDSTKDTEVPIRDNINDDSIEEKSTLNDDENINYSWEISTLNYDENINDSLEEKSTLNYDENVNDTWEISTLNYDGNINDSLEEKSAFINDENSNSILDQGENVVDLENKSSKVDLISEADSNLGKKCSTASNTWAWTTIESVSESGSEDNLAIDSMESTVQLMNDMIDSVEQMNKNINSIEVVLTEKKVKSEKNLQNDSPKSKSNSEITIETYSDNHVCNEYCNNIYVVNDDSFWDDDVSKSTIDNEKSILSFIIDDVDIDEHSIEVQNNKIALEKERSDINICCETTKINEEDVIDKISNESLKKYFSCESCKQGVNQVENNKSCSSMIEEYPIEKLSNVIIAIEQPYPDNEFLKLLKSDDSLNQYTNSVSNVQINSTLTLHNCDELCFEQNTNTNEIENNNNHPKPRIFRKCRRLLNKSRDVNTNATMRSDSKILQMYNEKLLEYRNKSIDDIEDIRTACSMLKSFNTQPEPCTACSLCKFSSNPSISSSCKCCDSKFKFKSKSVNKFSFESAGSLDQFH